MPGPARRRIDLARLPAAARYTVAFAVLAVVVGLVMLTSSDDAPTQPAGWYTVVVRIGAVLLILYCAYWLAQRLLRSRRR
jgi:peptidoglycan/LPS O-acetylase OafA/YrhL